MSLNINTTYAPPGATVSGIASNYIFSDTSYITRVETPLVVNGRDVMKELDEMRDALLLLKRDVDMEAKYPKLKELKDAYEAQLEKYKTFEALK